MAAVRARMRCATRAQTPAMVRPPWRSRSSWPLRVSLTDSMIWRRGLKNRCPAAWSLALAGGTQQVDAGVVEFGFERAAVVVLVADQGLAGRACRPGQGGCGPERCREDVAFVGFGAGQRPAHGQAVQGADQVQPQAPEEPGVGGAVAVLGPAGQVGAFARSRGTGRTRPGWSRPPTRRRSAMLVWAPSAADQPGHRVGASLRSRLL